MHTGIVTDVATIVNQCCSQIAKIHSSTPGWALELYQAVFAVLQVGQGCPAAAVPSQ